MKHESVATIIRDDKEYVVIEKIINGIKIISYYPTNHPDSEKNFNEFKRLLNAPTPKKNQ